MLRLEEEDIYAGIATSGSGGGSLPFMFMKMLTAGDMTSDTSFDVEWKKELPDLSTETYTASFTFEETEEDSGEWRLTCGVTKEGRYLGETDVYAIITAHDGSMSAPIKLTTLTKDGENPYTYGFSAGGYECYFYVEIENDTITFTGGNAYIGEDDYGSVNVYWGVKEPAPTPVQKGSFDSTTQQLTLKYDYLVEKINSSDQITAETKELIIGRLNNSDVVVDMTRDTISTTGHSSDIAWGFADDETEPKIFIFVSKSNPETTKAFIPADSGGVVFGSYNAIRAFYELQGQSKTAEEVEALLSSSVVDEEVFTISGTLGNFSVEFN